MLVVFSRTTQVQPNIFCYSRFAIQYHLNQTSFVYISKGSSGKLDISVNEKTNYRSRAFVQDRAVFGSHWSDQVTLTWSAWYDLAETAETLEV